MNLPAIRKTGSGLRGEEVSYHRHRDKYVALSRRTNPLMDPLSPSPFWTVARLPRQLERYRLSLPWPVDMIDPRIHIKKHHFEINTLPSVSRGNELESLCGECSLEFDLAAPYRKPWPGLEIQGGAETLAWAIESMLLIQLQLELQDVANLWLFSPASKLLYYYGGLSFLSLPQKALAAAGPKYSYELKQGGRTISFAETETLGRFAKSNFSGGRYCFSFAMFYYGRNVDGTNLERVLYHPKDHLAINPLSMLRSLYPAAG